MNFMCICCCLPDVVHTNGRQNWQWWQLKETKGEAIRRVIFYCVITSLDWFSKTAGGIILTRSWTKHISLSNDPEYHTISPFPHPVSSGSFLCLSKNRPVRSIEPKSGKTISISAWWHYPKEGHISLSAIHHLILDIFHSIHRSFAQNVRQRLNNVKYGDIIPGEEGGTDFLSPIYQLIQLFFAFSHSL